MATAAAAGLVALLAIGGCRAEAAPLAQELAEPDVVRRAPAGDARLGAALLNEYGCGACHVIPGVLAARGESGPPLDRYAERTFIAGALPNTAENLVRWIVAPQAIEPGTAMPDLGVSEEAALHMTAYLYTLDGRPRLRLPRVLRLPPDDGAWRSVVR